MLDLDMTDEEFEAWVEDNLPGIYKSKAKAFARSIRDRVTLISIIFSLGRLFEKRLTKGDMRALAARQKR